MPSKVTKSTMTWDAPTDQRLLLAIVETSNVKVDYEAVAAKMGNETVTCTAIAVKRHLSVLRASIQSGPVAGGAKRKMQTKIDSDGSGMAKRVKKLERAHTEKDDDAEDGGEEGVDPVKAES